MGDAAAKRDKPLFWKMQSAWPARANQPFHWVSYAVVDEHWKLVCNKDISYCQLFDLHADPFEMQDVSATQPAVVKKMKLLLANWKSTLPAKPSGDVFSVERQGL